MRVEGTHKVYDQIVAALERFCDLSATKRNLSRKEFTKKYQLAYDRLTDRKIRYWWEPMNGDGTKPIRPWLDVEIEMQGVEVSVDIVSEPRELMVGN